MLMDKAARENYDAVWYRVHRSRAGRAVPDWALHAGQRSASMERASSEVSRSEVSRAETSAPAHDGLSRSPRPGSEARTQGHNMHTNSPERGPRRTSPARSQERRPTRRSHTGCSSNVGSSSCAASSSHVGSPAKRTHRRSFAVTPDSHSRGPCSPQPRSPEPRRTAGSYAGSSAKGLHRRSSSGTPDSRSREQRSQEPRSQEPHSQEPRSQEMRSQEQRCRAGQSRTSPDRMSYRSPERFQEPVWFGSRGEVDVPTNTPRTIQSRRRNTGATGSAVSPPRRQASPKPEVARFDITGSWALTHSSGITCILAVTQEAGGVVFCGSQAVADDRQQPNLAPLVRGGVHGTSAVWRMVESGALYEARLEDSGRSMSAGHYWSSDGRELGTFSASRLEEDAGARLGPFENIVFRRPPPPGSASGSTLPSRPKPSPPQRSSVPRRADATAHLSTDGSLAPAASAWDYVSSTFGASLRAGSSRSGASALAWAVESLLDPPKARSQPCCVVCRGPTSGLGVTLCSACDRPVYYL